MVASGECAELFVQLGGHQMAAQAPRTQKREAEAVGGQLTGQSCTE